MSGKLIETIDWFLIIAVLILITLGTVIIFSLSGGASGNIGMDQIVFAIIGLIVAGVLTFIDYRTWRSLSAIFYILGIISLIAVLFLGDKTFGATRWIDFGIFQFQPSELMKLILIVSLSTLLSTKKNLSIKDIGIYFGLSLLPISLILMQPDLGSASVLFVISFVLLTVSKIPRIVIISIVALGLISAPIAYQFIAPYQRQRIITFTNPSADPQGTGYNVVQSKIAIGSGGIFGRGIGQGSQSQLNFLPVAHTDFIFAGVAEATGFIGSLTLILIMTLIVYRAILIARLSQDYFGFYIACAIATVFLYQTFVNVGGNLGLMPITGIPLPFVSFGGTAMVVYLTCIGILESIYLRHKKIRFN